MIAKLGRTVTALLALACVTVHVPAGAAPRPPWLVLRPGTVVRVGIAPWNAAGEPEAGLTQSAASLRVDFTATGARPGDVVYEPVGVRARVVRIAAGGIVLVHGIGSRWQAFALVDRLVPEVPPGTHLRVAGGFGGFADFYPALDTPHRSAQQIATGTQLVALALRVAPYDADTADLVRVLVRVVAGPSKAREGYVAVGYTGLFARRLSANASPSDRACSCLALTFDAP